MNHSIVPIPCKPWTLSGMSDRLIVSHYELNYGEAVRSLNAARDRLAAIDLAAAPAHDVRALKLEELDAAGSVFLHELYFGSMGPGSSGYTGDGKMPEEVSGALEQQFGDVAAWRREFVALARAMGGRSGWVLLSHSRGDGRLYNHIAFDHMQTMVDATPILALDMYEHAYHLEFGANVNAYINTFLRNIDWAMVCKRLLQATGGHASQPEEPRGETMPSISVEALATQLAKGERVQLLDARPTHYFSAAADMMADAVWRDPERVDEWCATLSREVPVAVYCAYGFYVGCSVTAALRERGFDARYVLGGLSAWYAAGGPRMLRPGSAQPQR